MTREPLRPNFKRFFTVKRWCPVTAIALLTVALVASNGLPLATAAQLVSIQSSQKPDALNRPPIRPKTICPTALEPLTEALLRDLPAYINRLSHQRGGSLAYRYAIASSPANFEPLPVVTSTLDPEQGGLYQVFFTLLERQYDTKQKTDYQTYHWLFLARTEKDGWQLSMLYSRSGTYPNQIQTASPLRETTQETTGLAVRQWLRDCQAGAISFP